MRLHTPFPSLIICQYTYRELEPELLGVKKKKLFLLRAVNSRKNGAYLIKA